MKYESVTYSSSQEMTTDNVPGEFQLWRLVLPYLGPGKYEFLTRTIRTMFDEIILKQFYISLYIQILNWLFCFLFKLVLRYLLINIYKKYLPLKLTYIHSKLTMVNV